MLEKFKSCFKGFLTLSLVVFSLIAFVSLVGVAGRDMLNNGEQIFGVAGRDMLNNGEQISGHAFFDGFLLLFLAFACSYMAYFVLGVFLHFCSVVESFELKMKNIFNT